MMNFEFLKDGLKDESGVFRMIDKNSLLIDESYQRATSKQKIDELSGGWSWIACGCIIVGNRNGSLFVVDGQHRVLAARKNGDITTLPCLIFETNGNKQEASAFLKTNTNRRPMSMFDRFNALIVSEDETALFCDKMIKDAGLVLSQNSDNGSNPQNFKAIGWVLRHAIVSRIKTEMVVRAAYNVAVMDDAHVTKMLLDGLDYIVQNMGTVDFTRLIERLKNVGHASIYREMSKVKTLSGEGGKLIYGTGILNAANKGLKKRFKLNDKKAQLSEV